MKRCRWPEHHGARRAGGGGVAVLVVSAVGLVWVWPAVAAAAADVLLATLVAVFAGCAVMATVVVWLLAAPARARAVLCRSTQYTAPVQDQATHTTGAPEPEPARTTVERRAWPSAPR